MPAIIMLMPRERYNSYLLASIAACAVLSALLVFKATRLGLWAGSDSAVYLASARNLLSGAGLKVIQPSGKAATLMPPLYPLLLSGLGALGLPLLAAARWLNVLLAAAAALLAGWVALRHGRAGGLAALAALALAVFPGVTELFSGLMTEPLFLVLLLASLPLLLAYLEGGRRAPLLAAGLLLGLATITRFIGIAFLPAGMLAVLLLARWPVRRRLADAALLALAALLPLGLWAIWFHFNPDASAPLDPPRWSSPWAYLEPVRNGFLRVFYAWLPFSDRLPLASKPLRVLALGLVGALGLGLALWGGRRVIGRRLAGWPADPGARLLALVLLFALSFTGTFVFIFLFRNPPQDVDGRTLLPLYPLLLLAGIAALSLAARATRRRWIAPAAVAMLALLLALAYLPASARLARQYATEGRGYSQPAWRDSGVLKTLDDLAPGMALISNDSGALLYFTGRTALEVREKYLPAPGETFSRYGDDTSDPAQAQFRQRQAALVLFMPSFYWQLQPIYGDQTQARIDALLAGLQPVYAGEDGGIYLYPTP